MLATLAGYSRLCPDMEPHFALSFRGRLNDELAKAQAPVHFLGEVKASRPFSVIRARRDLKRLLTTNPFDFVICHSPWSLAVFGPTAKSLGLALVFWLHDEARGSHWTERWARWTRPVIAICNSHFTARTLPKIFPGINAQVIYCPVPPSAAFNEATRQKIRGELQTRRDSVVIIQVSRMEEWKGHALLLRALERIKETTEWTCWFVGGSQRPAEVRYVERLRELASAAGLNDRIRFTGERSDVQALLASADIYCQPNLSPEPFGIAFIEALYSGLPVVATATGGAKEIVDDTCGILVPPRDEEALAGSLDMLIRDAAMRHRLGSRGPARASELCEVRTQLNLLKDSLATISERAVA